MPRWFEILLTIVLFAAGMAAVGWAVNASVPAGVDWLWDRIGGDAVWACIVAFWIVGGYFAWRGHRPNTGRPFGK